MGDSKMTGRTACRVLLRAVQVAVGLAVSLGAVESTMAQVQWKTGIDGVQMAPMSRAAIKAALDDMQVAGRGEAVPARRVVVSFDRPLRDDEKALLNASGMELLSFLGNNSYFASIDAGRLDAGRIAAVPAMRRVDQIRRDWKLHPDIVADQVRPWAIVGANDIQKAAKDIANPGEHGEPIVAVYVVLHQDVDAQAEGLPAVQRHAGSVVSLISTVNTLVVELPASNVKKLAEEDVVQYIEPPLPALMEMNSDARLRVGADIVQSAPYNLDGAGVNVMVFDGGKVFGHQDFGSRLTLGMSDTSSTSNHATHVAGTIGGSGLGSGGANRGMAPGVAIISYGVEQPGGLTQGFLYTNPLDLESDYTEAITVYGAVISNNSIGTNTAANGFPCSWQGDYGVTDTVIDSIVRGSIDGNPFRIVWANGNERGNGRCGTQFQTTAPPACAKNHITVGALNSNNDSVTSFTSWGPADDGRMKPDVSAPGCQSGGDGGITSTSSSGGYTVFCGTSMASPVTCGVSALLIQDFRVQFPGEPDFRNSTLKILLAHSAADLGNVGPDYQTGYGSIRAQAAVDLLRTGNFFEADVSQGGTHSAVAFVQPGTTELKVTIAWDDPAGTPNVSPALVNDLDLVVRSPSGVQHYPWTLGGLASPSTPAVRTQANRVDNIEQVLVNNPEPGVWSIEVVGFNVPVGPQDFSLVASPSVQNCSDVGSVSLNQQLYNCDSLATIKVVDCGLNLDNEVIETVMVTIASTSEPAGIQIVLSETSPESADFRSSIFLRDIVADASLLVAHGDTVTVTYMDADTGSGSPDVVMATATIDCVGPMISSVAAINVEYVTATVEFTTDEPTRPTVRYGSACGSFTGSVNSGVLSTSHSLGLSGLSIDTEYFFEVEATDAAGNVAIDDNGGDCYTFMTLDAADYFSELFTSGNDLAFRSILFTPSAHPDGYVACSFPITSLPTDPSGGTLLSLPDDSPSTLLNVGGGQSVLLYGASHTSFYVNPNGNITFGSSDSTTSESFSAHFSKPRIAALFDDLNPAAGGTVSWKQLSDRIVVTFQGVPQYNVSGDSNTFQTEMYFDGRIQISYLGIGATDGLAGLSEGLGLPVVLIPSDLSEYGSCGPMPPSAGNVSAAMDVAHGADVELLAGDDGLPDPPAALSYIITSLPAHGHIGDESGRITSVPHHLSGGNNVVRYAPLGSYQGSDSFTFIANDGGLPPEGGDSNTGTVSLIVGGPSPVHSFLTDDTNPGWSTQGQWAFGQPTGGGGSAGGGSGSPDPTAGFTGLNVYGYNLSGNYPNNLAPRMYLTSNAIDCSDLSSVSVEFQRWLGVESATYDRATFEVSNDGTNWTMVWQNPTVSMSPASAWTKVEHDIAAVADNQPTVFLRWGMGTTDSSVIYCGWNIDDIIINALTPAAPCLGDANYDGVVDFADISHILANWGLNPAAQSEGDANADGQVDFEDISAALASWGANCL